MNENLKPVPPGAAGATAAAAVNAPVANSAGGVGAPLGTAAGQSVPLFGGHRGGGKKRKDGLPAGSPEAKEADRKKDRERKVESRSAKKSAALPPPLPGVLASNKNPAAPLAGSSSALPVSLPGVAGAAAPLFVAWSQKLLERPAKLVTKIADRVRCWSLMKKIRQLGLTPDQEKEIAADLKWRDDVTADFNSALAECATIELNKRRVPGSENSHWLNLAMCGGEMALVHVQTLERIEKMVAANGGGAKKEDRGLKVENGKAG